MESGNPYRLDRRAWIAVGAVLALALAVRLGFWLAVRGTALDHWQRYDQSDMATYLAQAAELASGDWLAREPVHPYHGWQAVAPPEKWLEWYGPHAFHQAPGYAYALALASRALDDPLPFVKALQLACGALGAAFALLWGRELFGLAAGTVAGLLVAVYGPLYYLEAQILREGPALAALLALGWLLARELRLERSPRGAWLATGALGVAVGLLHAFHEMGAVVLGTFALVLGAVRRRGGTRVALGSVGALFGGYVLGFAPLLARNLAVGAAPFSVSCRTLVNFAVANEAGAPEGGATFIAPGPAVVRILDEAHGSFARVLAGVWRTYDGDVAKLVGNWWLRWCAVWKSFEEADNTSFYFYREYVPWLRASPNFAWLLPLGVAGLVAAAWARRASYRGNAPCAAVFGRHPRGQLAAVAMLFSVALALSFVHTVARFRLYATPPLFLLAGAGVVAAWRALVAGRLGIVAGLAGAGAAAALFQGAITRETDANRFRPVDFFVAASVSVELGQHERALAYADDSARRYTGDVNLYVVVGQKLEAARDWRAAETCYEHGLETLRALATPGRPAESLPHHAELERGLARVRSVPESRR